MERINHPSATPDRKFTEGDPALGIPATTVTANHMNGIQEELIHILEEAEITPDGANFTQVLEALRVLFVRKDVPERTWISLIPGVTSTVKSKRMPDNTLHIYGQIDKPGTETVSPGANVLYLEGDPYDIGDGKFIWGLGFGSHQPTSFSLTYKATDDRTYLGYYTAWDTTPRFLSIWQVVPCVGV